MLLITACTNETTETTEKIVVVETGEETNYADFEMRLTDGTFSPDTIEVNVGDTVRLDFVNTEPYTFSLEAYGVMDTVSNNRLEFVANEVGIFEFICLDCDGLVTGVLKVN